MKFQSSNISEATHENGTLTITFKSGHVWKYANVPPEIWEEFQKAESPGSFFHKNIRGIFEGTDVTPAKEEVVNEYDSQGNRTNFRRVQ